MTWVDISVLEDRENAALDAQLVKRRERIYYEMTAPEDELPLSANGRAFCIDCQRPVSRGATRCVPCSGKRAGRAESELGREAGARETR